MSNATEAMGQAPQVDHDLRVDLSSPLKQAVAKADKLAYWGIEEKEKKLTWGQRIVGIRESISRAISVVDFLQVHFSEKTAPVGFDRDALLKTEKELTHIAYLSSIESFCREARELAQSEYADVLLDKSRLDAIFNSIRKHLTLVSSISSRIESPTIPPLSPEVLEREAHDYFQNLERELRAQLYINSLKRKIRLAESYFEEPLRDDPLEFRSEGIFESMRDAIGIAEHYPSDPCAASFPLSPEFSPEALRAKLNELNARLGLKEKS